MAAKTVLLLKNRTTPVDHYNEEFSAKEFRPVFVPLLDHQHLDKAAIAEYLLSERFLEHTSSFIITSQRAVEVLNESMDLVEPTELKERIFAKPAYTVGPATAKILSAAGFRDVRGGAKAGNGTVLSDIIISDPYQAAHSAQEILFFTGEIRKDIIPRKLAGADFNLVEKVIYRTVLRDGIVERFYREADPCSNDGNSWIVFFSPQGTETIVEHIRDNRNELKRFKIASIGPTTEQYLLENGIKPDVVAAKPDAASLTASILAHSNSTNASI